MTQPQYQQAGPAMQRLQMRRWFTAMRQAAKGQVFRSRPDLYQAVRLRNLDPDILDLTQQATQ